MPNFGVWEWSVILVLALTALAFWSIVLFPKVLVAYIKDIKAMLDDSASDNTND